jgi:HlyD family secretion protein
MARHPKSRGFRACILTWTILLVGIAGCKKPSPPVVETKQIPQVSVVYPTCGLLEWEIHQPGSLSAFEETPIFAKISGYVQKWNVDIGDRVKKGDILAELWVPDVVADLNLKKVEVRQARQMLEVAQAHLASAAATVEEARAGLSRARANLKFWQMQFERISKLNTVIDKQVKEETRNQLQSAEAGVKEAEAKVSRTEADRKESAAARNKSQADIAVAEAAREKMQTLVDYATLTAPFDGVITQRNINTHVFVQPPTGGSAAPLYIVQRRDLMRAFVDVPEGEAVWVQKGAAARLRIPVLKGREFAGDVKRMSYAVKRQSRTLLVEIDLPNPKDLLRPGMYLQASIQMERRDALSLPADAVATQGDVNEGEQSFCFVLENGKIRRIPIEVGACCKGRVEVLKKQVDGSWIDFNGAEMVVRGELSALADGQEVHVSATDKKAQAHRAAERIAIVTPSFPTPEKSAAH